MKVRIFEVESDEVDKAREVTKDELFSRRSNGFELRSAEGLGLEGNIFYLRIDGGEEFWEEAEDVMEGEGFEELEKEEFEKVEEKFKEQSERKGLGVGALFK